MRKLVLEAHETKFLMGLFISFLMLFLIIFISILLQLAGSEASRKAFLGVLVYLAFAAVVIALLLFSLKRLRERARKATLLAKESILEENRLLFPLELEFEYGRVELFNHPERRRLIKDFKALEKKRTSIFEFPNKEFKFIGTYEEGFASFPAIRILTKPYEGQKSSHTFTFRGQHCRCDRRTRTGPYRKVLSTFRAEKEGQDIPKFPRESCD